VAFTRAEGIIPAPEAAHSIAAAMRVAKERDDEKLAIVFLLTGHGHFDTSAYGLYITGQMEESATPVETIRESLRKSQSATSPRAAHDGATSRSAGQVQQDSPTARAGSASFQVWWQRHFSESASTVDTPTAVVRGSRPTSKAVVQPGVVDLRSSAVITARVLTDLVSGDDVTIRVATEAVITPLAEEEIHRRSIRVERETR
jgi:hypothetical protein